jgi:hypothetical protein
MRAVLTIAAGAAALVLSATAPAGAAQVCSIGITQADQNALQNAIATKLQRAQCQKGDVVLMLVRGEAAMPTFAITYFCDLDRQVIIEPKDRLMICEYAGAVRTATPLIE